MIRIIRDWRWSLAAAIALLALIAVPIGCSQLGRQAPPAAISELGPIVRVLIVEPKPEIQLAANVAPTVRIGANGSPRKLNLSDGHATPLRLSRSGWMIGNASVGKGELIIEPAAGGWISVNERPYRGSFHFVAAADGANFESVNYVYIEDYLKSVVPRELLRDWHAEAYMAQAIIARTYALYEKNSRPVSPRYDLYADTRSQVYGGLKDETEKSRASVDQTRGIVVVSGQAGQERIFKAYFSACCGGLSASAADVFGDAPSEPLSEQNNGTTCNMSTSFNWGPITVPRPELTRRFRAWGASKNRPERNIAQIKTISVAALNSVGRPVRFEATDATGQRYSLKAEELRWAVNYIAPDAKTRLKSSFCRPIVEGDTIQFVDGHGSGHGVGMCQWCCQARALAGWKHDRIVVAAYRGSKLARAY